MKKLLFTALILSLFAGFTFAQEEKEVEIKEEKKIIIKIVDEDGKVTTKVISEGDDAAIEADNIWISENGDSIQIEVEVEEGDGSKVVKKRIVIPDLGEMDMEALKDLEKNIEIYEFDDEDGHFDGPHMFFIEGKDFPQEGFLKGHGLKEFGEKKAKLGVYIEDAENGVKVKEVIENSAAYSVGILAGDVITKINDKKMTNIEELMREVGSQQPGDMIEIKLKRNGKSKKFTVRLHGESNILQPFHGQQFQDGMKRFKHHLYRGIDECEKEVDHFKKRFKHDHDCDKKCTGDHKNECIKEKKGEKEIKDVELKLKKKKFKDKMEEKPAPSKSDEGEEK